MRKTLLALPLILGMASCANFTWQGQGSDQSAGGRRVKDIAELNRQYETTRLWSSVRARRDGRVNAFGRDLASLMDTLDRHLFNYSPSDPAVNFPTDLTLVDHIGRIGVTAVAR